MLVQDDAINEKPRIKIAVKFVFKFITFFIEFNAGRSGRLAIIYDAVMNHAEPKIPFWFRNIAI
jgi:hypothetical protein